jgi:hypothetical protein
MPDQLQQIVQRMIDAGESEDNIASVIREYGKRGPAAPKAEPGVLERVGNFVKNHPTEIGATLGGIAAVPLTGGTSLWPAMAAAGLGGAGGAGLGMLAGAATGTGDAPATASGVLRAMGEEGAMQAGAEAGGRAISGVLRAGANRLYQSVLKPTLAARTEYPTLVQTAVENAIPVSKGGAEKAAALKEASMQTADQLVHDASAQPGAPTIDPRQAVSGITDAIQSVRDLPVARPQMKAIGDYGRQYLAEHPTPMTLEQAQRAVRATDKYYDPAYRATIDRSNALTNGQTAAAVGINDETRGLLRQAVPGLQAQNANTSALRGVEDAVARRAGQQGNLSAVGMQHLINAGLGAGAGELYGRDRGIGTFAAMEMLTNPMVASQIAIRGAQASRLPLQQAVRAALLARLTGSTEPEQ